MIDYTVELPSPEAHLYQVSIHIPDPEPHDVTFSLPAWIRGSYMIRDFSRHIIIIDAEDSTGPLAIKKLDKQTWRCEPASGDLTIRYQVYAWDLSVRGAHMDTTHAYFNGAALFLAVHGKQQEPLTLTINRPAGERYESWRVAAAMRSQGVDEQGFGCYLLQNYEELIDQPVEIGVHDAFDFAVAGKPHRFVVAGRHSADLNRLKSDLTRICSQQVALFGELPLNDYLFLLSVVGEGYGGLEHQNSTSLLASRKDLPGRYETEPSKNYRRLLGLCSHEYFHLWNVKRITPAVFLENDTSAEVHTRQMWVFEGITSYYDDLMLLKSGCIKRKDYFELLAETVTRVMRGRGRLKQTLEESSFDAWTKFYKQDENAPNAIVSYYAKGALFALLLDLRMRLESDGASSLDHVMQVMWHRYGKPGIGVPERGFEQVAMEVTGLDLAPLFELGLRTTQELPLQESLAAFGVQMRLRPASGPEDNGGVVTDEQVADAKPRSVLGARIKGQDAGEQVVQVYEGGAAMAAGIAAGDLIVAVDGLRVRQGEIEKRIAVLPPGEAVPVHAFRRDELMQFELVPQVAPADTCEFYLPEAIPPAQQARRDAWLRSL